MWRQNSAFFPVASTRVSRICGWAIFKGIPGKPAPVPTSMARPTGREPMAKRQVRESRKCLISRASGSVIAVRLTRSFHAMSSAE